MNAETLVRLLAERHAADVFVAECKNGRSWGASPMRLDAWALKRSWSPLHCYGYEVKVSRRDFMQDDKWPGYLDCCHSFYFVAPPGVIDTAELPAEVGLIVASKNGRRLYTKRKAAYRDIEVSPDILFYVLMSRVRVVANMYEANDREPDTVEQWRAWLAQKDDERQTGHLAAAQIARMVEERVRKVKDENTELRKENQHLAEVRALCAELGIKPDPYGWHNGLRAKIEAARELVPLGLLADAEQLCDKLRTLHDRLTRGEE